VQQITGFKLRAETLEYRYEYYAILVI